MLSVDVLSRTELFSEELEIRLRDRHDGEFFKWFVASLLFGGRISETIAKNTYRAFVRHQLVTPMEILVAEKEFLVKVVLREGGYVRYDGRKSAQILRDCEKLVDDYGGSLKKLHDTSSDSADLENRLLAFDGVGPVTLNIFLRELRPFWRKARPRPLPVVTKLARKHGIDLSALDPRTVGFARVEAGLLRMRHSIRRRK